MKKQTVNISEQVVKEDIDAELFEEHPTLMQYKSIMGKDMNVIPKVEKRQLKYTG